MNKKHLLVFTGGTISASQKDSEIIRGQKTFELLKNYDAQDFDIIEPVDILSENMTPEIIFRIFKHIADKIKGQNYKSIIVTHGTDTLAYTAQCGALLLSQLPFPVIFLGSKLPAGHPEMDGKINFHHAYQLAEQVNSGVFVVSRHQNGSDIVFAAENVQQADFTSDDFSAFQNHIFGWFKDGKLVKNTSFHPCLQVSYQNSRLPDAAVFIRLFENPETDTQSSQINFESYSTPFQYLPEPFQHLLENEKITNIREVLMIPAYVGQDYSIYDLENFKGKYILHQMYHSGTACIQGVVPNHRLTDFARRCKQAGKRLFIAPLYSDRALYETTAALLKEDVTPLYDMPVERAWAVLTLASWLNG